MPGSEVWKDEMLIGNTCSSINGTFTPQKKKLL